MGMIPAVNLLPESRLYQTIKYRLFYKISVIIIVALCLIEALVHIGFAYFIHQQTQYNQVLSETFSQLLPQWEEASTLQKARQADIDRFMWLQQQRRDQQNFKNWLMEISGSIPAQVSLDALIQEGEEWIFVGNAPESTSVMEWVQALQKMPCVKSASLEETHQTEGKSVQFHLKVHTNLYRIPPLAD